MQKVSASSHKRLTELLILEALIDEQDRDSDQPAISVDSLSLIRDYARASEVILIVFDPANAGRQTNVANGKHVPNDRKQPV
jgi:hypothetical protein